MIRFWSHFIEPLLLAHKPAHIVEIGAQAGGNTRNILEYCAGNGARATIIDPLPIGNIELIADLLAAHGTHAMGLSLDVLPKLDVADAYLIDGDHNWYTVYHEIRSIVEPALAKNPKKLPILMFHDVGWPYGKRDLYYDPSTVPPEGVLPYVKGGIAPGVNTPTPGEGFNAHLCNAVDEGTPKNGVGTAVEDAAKDYAEYYDLYRLPGWHGLGLLAPKKGLNKAAQAVIAERFTLSPLAEEYVDQLENSRCELLVTQHDTRHALREKEREAKSLTREIRAQEKRNEHSRMLLEKDVEQLYNAFNQLYQANESLMSSLRWRIGNAVVNVVARLTGRSRTNPALAHMKTIRGRVESTNAVKRIVERREEADSRRFIHRSFDDAALAFAADRLSGKNPVTVIVPIYNAPEATRRCIDSVLKHTRAVPYQLLLINDASPDKAIKRLLAEYEGLPNIRILHHDKNQGFVRTANHSMREAKGDVVLLNSDTEVTSRWLMKLVAAAGSNKKIATVTPLSNAAGAFSVPEAGKVNDIPESLGLEGMARIVENLSERAYPEVPTGNGFCMYIKRVALDEVGLFDEETFGRGYGEENDFCMRAGAKGWVHIIDDATYIYHERSASFGADKEALIAENRTKLDARHPDYTAKVKAFLADPTIADIRGRIGTAMGSPPPKPRMLYVLHQGGGGTPYTNMDLMQHIDASHHCFLLTSDAKTLVLWELLPGRKLEQRQSWHLADRWRVEEFHNRFSRLLYFSLLTQLNVDLVHIRHLLGHTFDLPEVADFLGLHVVMSFHDFYSVCPSVHLLTSEGKYCGGACTQQAGQCKYPLSWLKEDAPHLSSFNAEWREEIGKMLAHCDEFITTTEAARKVHVDAFGDLLPLDRFHVFEHGRDFPEIAEGVKFAGKVPEPGQSIDILFPGQLGFNKGLELIRELKQLDKKAGRLHFHFLGKGSEHLGELGTIHGEYERDEFFDKVKAIQPSFMGIFSIWPETYCHTLSESWACGIPVIASDIGAIAERVNKHHGGWLIDYTDAKKAYAQILKIADDAEDYRRKMEAVALIQLRGTQTMASDYLSLYMRLKAA